MTRRHTAIAVSVAIVLAATVLLLTAARPRPTLSSNEASQVPLSAHMFEPVEVAKVKLDPLSALVPTPKAAPKPVAATHKTTVKPLAKIKATRMSTTKRLLVTSRPVGREVPRMSHAATGRASWYCKAGVSICHYAYGPGSMVAAACSALQAAMGSNWRGKSVTVTNRNNGKSVTVVLVDSCASTSKVIDLYFAPMSLLGGTGTLPVVIRW